MKDKPCKEFHHFSNAYKECMEQHNKAIEKDLEKQDGLGDKVHKALHSPAMAPVTKAIKKAIWKDGKDCGCDKRREFLNSFPKRSRPKCLTQELYQRYEAFREDVGLEILNGAHRARSQQVRELEQIYAKAFNKKAYKVCLTCPRQGKVIRKMLEQLDRLYLHYQREVLKNHNRNE